jgi:hypothetical protein
VTVDGVGELTVQDMLLATSGDAVGAAR